MTCIWERIKVPMHSTIITLSGAYWNESYLNRKKKCKKKLNFQFGNTFHYNHYSTNTKKKSFCTPISCSIWKLNQSTIYFYLHIFKKHVLDEKHLKISLMLCFLRPLSSPLLLALAVCDCIAVTNCKHCKGGGAGGAWKEHLVQG